MNETTLLKKKKPHYSCTIRSSNVFRWWQSNAQHIINSEIFHKRNWYLTKLAENFWKQWLSKMVLKETDCNNYIVLIEKYLGCWSKQVTEELCVSEFSKCNQKSPVITRACIRCAQFLSLMGCFQLPHGPLIVIKLMSICNLTPLTSVFTAAARCALHWTANSKCQNICLIFL